MSRRGAPAVRRLTESEVIALLKAGRYKVNRDTAEVIGPKGKPIKPYDICGDGRAWMRVYGFGGCRTLARSRLVWLSVVLQPLPSRDWEVHHVNLDKTDDRWENLIALHKLDHRKQHAGQLDETIPF